MRLLTIVSVFAILMAGQNPAQAADWYTGAPAQRNTDDWIVAVNTSVDITSQNSHFADVNGTMAPAGTLNQSGVRLRVDGVAGTYQYQSTSSGSTVHGAQESGAALAGYEWITPDTSVAAYIGADYRHDSLSIPDPGNPVVGASLGLKTSLEFNMRPSANTAVSGYGSYETNKSAYFTRLRGGYQIAPDLYLGPEVAALGDAFFNQERAGVYLGGLKFANIKIALATGYLYDRVRKGGAYASIDARIGF